MLVAAALAAEARADDLCPNGRIAVDYDGSVRPEHSPDPWTLSYDGIDPETDVFAEDGILTVDATGFGAVFFGREEPIDSLAPAYRFEVRARTVGLPDLLCPFPATCFRLGAHGLALALAQDRVLNFEVWVTEDPDVGVLAVHGKDETHDLGPVDTSEFAVVTVEAIRDGTVTVSWDGELRAEFLWSDLPTLDDLEPNPALLPLLEQASDQTVVPVFGAVRIRTEWDRVRYEICHPETENVDVWVETQLPDEPDGRTLKGGTGETLEGLERIHATLERIEIRHRSDDRLPGEGTISLTLLDEPQPFTLVDAAAVDGMVRAAGLIIPPGELHEVTLSLSDLTVDLRGESHPVRQRGPSTTNLTIQPRMPIIIPEEDRVSLVVTFDPYQTLGRNAAGFWMDPVTLDAGLGEPWEPSSCFPTDPHCPIGGGPAPGRLRDPTADPGPLDPDPTPRCPPDFFIYENVCVRECPSGTVQFGNRCLPPSEDPDEEDPPWLPPVRPCSRTPARPEDALSLVPPELADEFIPRPCVCRPLADGWQHLPSSFSVRQWLNNDRAHIADETRAQAQIFERYNPNQDIGYFVHGNTYIRRMAVNASLVDFPDEDNGDYLDLVTMSPPIRQTRLESNVDTGVHLFPDHAHDPDGEGRAQDYYYGIRFVSDDGQTAQGVEFSSFHVQCRDEPLPQPIPVLNAPVPIIGLLLDTEDVVFFRVPASSRYAQALLLSGVATRGRDQPAEWHPYARQGALPTRTVHDRSATDAGSTEQFLLLSRTGQDAPDWYIAVHSSSGWGQFALQRSLVAHRRGDIRIGVDFDMVAAGQRNRTEQHILRAAKNLFTASQGTVLLSRFRVFNNDTKCGGNVVSACSVIIRQSTAGGRSWHNRLTGVVTLNFANILRNDFWVLPHEWFHQISGLKDEYKGSRPRCGHSVMASTRPGHYRTVCTAANHGRDHHPDVNPATGLSRWERFLQRHFGSQAPIELQSQGTLPAHDRGDHGFGSHFRIERMNY